MRQNVDLRDIGRYKTNVVAERICHKNPQAQVETHEVKITSENEELVREWVRRADIVVGSVDNLDPRLVLNKVCVEEGKPLILMGAMHLAYALQIIFMRRPCVDPCYLCFRRSLTPDVRDLGFSALDQGHLGIYADRPVQQVEPGLSTDIAPMNTMTVKLCLNHLLRGKPTTFSSLDEDLMAGSHYIFLNRREPGTPFEELEPLGLGVGTKMRILRWYGMPLERQPDCPVCGDFVGQMAKRYGISITDEDARKHTGQTP
jgi:molybdopterin/thiamine biosynthesis adenylyltransferase